MFDGEPLTPELHKEGFSVSHVISCWLTQPGLYMQPAMFCICFHERPCVKELVPRWGYRNVLRTLRRIFGTYWKVLNSLRMWIQKRIWTMHYSPFLRFASLTWGNKLFSTTYSHHDVLLPHHKLRATGTNQSQTGTSKTNRIISWLSWVFCYSSWKLTY